MVQKLRFARAGMVPNNQSWKHQQKEFWRNRGKGETRKRLVIGEEHWFRSAALNLLAAVPPK